MDDARHRLLVMHPMDPRGGKLGGIETHVRMILDRHPQDFSILFVGVDEFGDRPLGRVAPLAINGRVIDFLPVARIKGAAINLPGRSILGSTTFRFACGALRHLRSIARAVWGRRASADLQRFEFALFPRLLGLKHVQMVHGEGSKTDAMDSLIKAYWAVHRLNETIALTLAARVLCVNGNIIKRLERVLPRAAAKAEVMSVSVDVARFAPQPFDCADGVFRVVFAGRLDAFKDPPLMFRVLARLRERLGGALEFHYAGTTDPHRFAEFAAIEDCTIRHGFLDAAGVARVLARCHAGVLTSFFEGMPCFLLEALSVGRPFVAIRLPQYDPLIEAGVSGALVERGAFCEEALVEAFVALWADVRTGRIDPARVHARIEPFSIENQMARLFAHHRALQTGAAVTPRVNAPLAPVDAPR